MKIDKQKVEEWKKLHGEIFQIETQGKSCIVRKPTRKEYSYVSVVKNPIKAQETLLNQIWLDVTRKSRPTMIFSSQFARNLKTYWQSRRLR